MEYTPFGMGDMADFRVKDMLATLKDHYVGKSGVAANIQLSRLYGLRARNGEDIKLLLTKMDGCFDALADQDMAKGDREKVAAFLAKLKDLTGWESFRLDLSRKGKGVTWHQVKSMAAAYDESRRLDQAESGRARVGQFVQTGGSEKKPCYQYAKNGTCKFGQKCKFAHVKDSGKSGGNGCKNCNKPGHKARTCGAKCRWCENPDGHTRRNCPKQRGSKGNDTKSGAFPLAELGGYMFAPLGKRSKRIVRKVPSTMVVSAPMVEGKKREVKLVTQQTGKGKRAIEDAQGDQGPPPPPASWLRTAWKQDSDGKWCAIGHSPLRDPDSDDTDPGPDVFVRRVVKKRKVVLNKRHTNLGAFLSFNHALAGTSSIPVS